MPANANTQQYRQGSRSNMRNSDSTATNSTNNNGYHSRQNGGYSQKQQRPNNSKGNADYWHKNSQQQNGPPNKDNSVKRNDENAGPSNTQTDKSKGQHQRNDRYPPRTPSASAPISVQRGPLPDWDEVCEAAQNEG